MTVEDAVCLVLGGCTIDTILDEQGRSHKQLCGGNALFAAAGANYWLAPGRVRVASRVAKDYPEEWLAELARAGIDISHVERDVQSHQSEFAASYDGAGKRTLHDGTMEDKEHKPNFDPILDYAFVSGLPPSTFIHLAPMLPRVVLSNLELLRLEHCWTMLDPGEESELWSDADRRAIAASVNALVPSVEELSWIAPKLSANEPASVFQDPFLPDLFVIKRGMAGSVVYQKSAEQFFAIPIVPVNAMDPTGAGDAFCGGFLAGMASMMNPFVAALMGTVSASFIVQEFGVLAVLTIDRAELWRRFDWLVQTTGIQLDREVQTKLRRLVQSGEEFSC